MPAAATLYRFQRPYGLNTDGSPYALPWHTRDLDLELGDNKSEISTPPPAYQYQRASGTPQKAAHTEEIPLASGRGVLRRTTKRASGGRHFTRGWVILGLVLVAASSLAYFCLLNTRYAFHWGEGEDY